MKYKYEELKKKCEEMIESTRQSLFQDTILEKYYSQQNILASSRDWELMLGAAQRTIKEKEKLVDFLEKYAKDLS